MLSVRFKFRYIKQGQESHFKEMLAVKQMDEFKCLIP